jgi:hypothetical protein
MQNPRKPIRITDRSIADRLPSEIDSRDMTRSELLFYILFPFTRYSYIIGCIFLDALIISQLYLIIPGVQYVMSTISIYQPKFNLFTFLFFMQDAVLLSLFIYMEGVFYSRKLSKRIEEDRIIAIMERKTKHRTV